MFMAFAFNLSVKCLMLVKFGASVGVEMRGMSHSWVLKSALMLSMFDCVFIIVVKRRMNAHLRFP